MGAFAKFSFVPVLLNILLVSLLWGASEVLGRGYTNHANDYYFRDWSGSNTDFSKPKYKYNEPDHYWYSDHHKWRTGRSTYYGDQNHNGMHYGSCGYGQIKEGFGTGLDIAAISDQHYDYQWSCGRCYEIKCRPVTFKDNYGNYLERTGACWDPNRVVIVTIIDVCPCSDPLPWNQSNKRWCCGDMEHFDLSHVAFSKLANLKWGVIGTWYRPVQCPYNSFNRRHHFEDHLLPGYKGKRKLQEEGPQLKILGVRYDHDVSPKEKLWEKPKDTSPSLDYKLQKV